MAQLAEKRETKTAQIKDARSNGTIRSISRAS